MAELALGVLGVVPLIGLAFKTGRSLRTKLKAFRHYSDDLCNINREFELENNFLDRECKILLRLVLEEREANLMKQDDNHPSWLHNETLESELQIAVGTAYEDYYHLLSTTRKHMKDLDELLQCFDVLTREREKGEKLKATVCRVKKRVHVTFSHDTFKKIHNSFRSTNRDIATLREQIKTLQKPRKKPQVSPNHQSNNDPSGRRRGDWGAIRKTRRISHALHGGLQGAWSCGEFNNHGHHSVKLFLELTPLSSDDGDCSNDAVTQLNMAIIGFETGSRVVQTTACSFRVLSQNVDWIETPSSPPHDEPDSSNYGARKRQKKVAFVFSPVENPPKQYRDTSFSETDLNRSPDICFDLIQKQTVVFSTTRKCLGYLDVRDEECLRYRFFHSNHDHPKHRGEAWPLTKILRGSVLEKASFQDRLKVAKSVAKAGLTYYATAWLTECWSLRDFLFHATADDLTSALQSLHLGADLVGGRVGSDGGGNSFAEPMHGILTPNSSSSELSQRTEDELLYCGIKSKALWSLGVALLMIDKWTELDPSDVVSVRKASRSNSNFGEKYRKLVESCLECQFPPGHDLDRPQLHKTVYEEVVGSLDRMIEAL